jgi:transcriptional repressor NrdR
MVLRRLYDLDKVAYIRFASVYRKYETADEFLREIESLGVAGHNPEKHP